MASHYIQANTMGRLHDASEPSLSPLNRGFLYGDGIYEVWRTYHGVLFAVEEHWRRLNRSAQALGIPVGISLDSMIHEIGRTATAHREATGHAGELYVRLQVSRGSGPIGLDIGLASAVEWVILVQSLRTAGPAVGRTGMRLSVARELRRNPIDALNPAWKTGNYLNNILCLREARARGADEVVILNQEGAVAEAAVCNLFFVARSGLVTPPLGVGILEGITRELVLREIAGRAGLAVRESTIRPEDFGSFTECFLTSTTRDIEPVESIDDRGFEVGPSTVTAVLKLAVQEYAAEYSLKHPEWRIQPA